MACLFLAGFLIAGCCRPCLKPTLPLEPHPNMTAVRFDPAAEYCITDQGRRNMLENLELYRAALERCNGTLQIYNATATP